jgi:hypothetical protein
LRREVDVREIGVHVEHEVFVHRRPLRRYVSPAIATTALVADRDLHALLGPHRNDCTHHAVIRRGRGRKVDAVDEEAEVVIHAPRIRKPEQHDQVRGDG